MKHTLYLLFAFFTLVSASCGKDDDNGGPDGPYSVLSADIDGEKWSAQQGYVQADAATGIALYALQDDNNSIILRINPYNGVQNYPIGSLTTAMFTRDGVQYSATTGNITIIVDNELGVQGKFTFDATSGNGTVQVRNGEFSLPRQ